MNDSPLELRIRVNLASPLPGAKSLIVSGWVWLRKNGG